MKAYNLSVVVGTHVCNARCPFCVSKMTPAAGAPPKKAVELNRTAFKRALMIAKTADTQVMLITGKGEPTVYPDAITEVLEAASIYEQWRPPIIELQTNGYLMARDIRFNSENDDVLGQSGYLYDWYEVGLSTIAISVVHWSNDRNKEIYMPHLKSYFNLEFLVRKLKKIGYCVRLSVVMLKGYIDTPEAVANFSEMASGWGVDQMTFRPVNVTHDPVNDPDAHRWTVDHMLHPDMVANMVEFFDEKATLLMTMPYGGRVYDYNGRNVCLTNCLTHSTNEEEIRQLIYFPDGHVRYSWEYAGAILC